MDIKIDNDIVITAEQKWIANEIIQLLSEKNIIISDSFKILEYSKKRILDQNIIDNTFVVREQEEEKE